MLAKHTSVGDAVVAPSGIWKVFLFTEDAAALYAQAIAAGATAVQSPKLLEQFGVTVALVKDPDGYLIEIGQRH